MALRCVVGDLVRFTQGPNRDRFGRIVSVGPGGIHSLSGLPRHWIVRPASSVMAHIALGLLYKVSGEVCTTDSWLMPIRDQPGADETLTWAGKPATINQPKETA